MARSTTEEGVYQYFQSEIDPDAIPSYDRLV